MNSKYYIFGGLIAVLLGVIILLIIKKKRSIKKVKTRKFTAKWRQLQKLCTNKDDWARALKDADELLDQVLKKKKFKGKTMGARLMAAQRHIKDNDRIWVAHNLSKKIYESDKGSPKIKLTKTQVKESLESFQETLIDLGALRRASK